MKSRVERAQSLAIDHGADAILITPGADLRYLTGYAALPLERLTCLVIRANDEPALIVPQLEHQAAVAAGTDVEIMTWAETQNPFDVVRDLVGTGGTVLVDDQMWASRVFALRDTLRPAQFSIAGPLLSQLRIRKDRAEIDALREAGQAIDAVHQRMAEWLRPGRSEHDIGADIASAMLEHGHETVDFVIVGSGPNGASPHHELSDRVVETGDPVVVDIGGTMASGYCSDCTRTYVAGGSAPTAFIAAYDVLQSAQQAQREHAGPGVSAESVDRVGRQMIETAGYGDLFMHRTGHGIGQETHEEPYIVEGNDRILEPGMAFSIEPGIYHDRLYGARIEDIVVVTDTGIESLNNTDRALAHL